MLSMFYYSLISGAFLIGSRSRQTWRKIRMRRRRRTVDSTMKDIVTGGWFSRTIRERWITRNQLYMLRGVIFDYMNYKLSLIKHGCYLEVSGSYGNKVLW